MKKIMEKKNLILIGIAFLVIIFLIFLYYQFFLIKDPVPPVVKDPIQKIIPADEFIEHISEFPDGGGEINVPGQAKPIYIFKEIFQKKVIPADEFVDYVAEFPDGHFSDDHNIGETSIYPIVDKIPGFPIVPPTEMIEKIQEFPMTTPMP